jgi:hypothetical protein
MNVSREVKTLAVVALGILAIRSLVLILDSIAEAVERRSLYR